MSDVIFSLSGQQIILTIVDPTGKSVNDSSCGDFLSLKAMKICSVQNPEFGIWKLIVSSISAYSLRAVGTSNITFIYGFQIEWSSSINGTSHQPLTGIENFILLQPSNSSQIMSFTNCEILSLDGISIGNVQLYRAENVSTLLYYGSFKPTSSNFHLRVNGITKFGYLFQRITSSAIYSSAGITVINIKLLPTNQTLLTKQSFNLTCVVHSPVPFKVKWLKNGIDLNRTEYLTKNEKVVLEFSNLSITDTGNYTCVVVRGNATKSLSTDLQVLESPVINEKFFNAVSLKIDEDYALNCTAIGFPLPTLRWFFNKSSEITRASGYDEHRVLLPNNTLLLLNTELNQSGKYSCVATNEVGYDEHRYDVSITNGLETDSSVINVKVLEGGKVWLACPEMRTDVNVQWLKNDSPLDMKPNERADEPRYTLTNNGKKLRIIDVYRDDSGFYSCVSFTTKESSRYNFFLHVLIAPNFVDLRETVNVTVLAGENVTFNCTVDGYPKPSMTWKKNNFKWPVNQWTMVNASLKYPLKQILQIYHVSQKDHSGKYQCIAKNEVALIQRYFQLHIDGKDVKNKQPLKIRK